MTEPAGLREFLIYAAENGYANDAVVKMHEADGSTTIQLQSGEWRAHDNYFTSKDGRRYYGRMVAFRGERAMWFCGYSGFVTPGADSGDVYGFLKQAMLRPDPAFPVRGPAEFAHGVWRYEFHELHADNDLNRFIAQEVIRHGGNIVYFADFIGGSID